MATLTTSAIDAGHLDSYHGSASENSRRLTLQDLLLTEPVQRSGSNHSSPVGCSRTPSPTEPTNSTMLQYHHNRHTSPPLGSHHVSGYTHQLPPPISQQRSPISQQRSPISQQRPPISQQCQSISQQCMRISSLYKPSNPAME
ncbi:12132_t:CDS:1, partial [Cetraspora pellucida]